MLVVTFSLVLLYWKDSHLATRYFISLNLEKKKSRGGGKAAGAKNLGGGGMHNK